MSRAAVLVIAPHPDDETLGCGGTIRLRIEKGERVSVVFLTSGELGLKHLSPRKAWAIRETEARRAAKILGITCVYFLRLPDWVLGEHLKKAATALRPVLRATTPGIVYVPHPEDGHPDHQAAWPLLKQAWPRRLGAEPEVFGYEIWSPIAQPDCLVDISSVMPRKIRALRAHHSQLGQFDYVRAIIGLNQFRGSLGARCDFAEAFRRLPLR
jgi:LmbE family N-acetylglucosaminyl deacetylase